MLSGTSTDGIIHVIQLATAPVFLLTAVGALIGVLTTRLSRIIDRSRELDALGGRAVHPVVASELGTLGRRLHLVYLAITLQVFCGLFVGLVIVTAFFDALLATNLTRAIVGLFVLAMVSFIASLVVFLREIFLSVLCAGLDTASQMQAAAGRTGSNQESG